MTKKRTAFLSLLIFILGGVVGALGLMLFIEDLGSRGWQTARKTSTLFPAGAVGETLSTLEDLRAGDTNGARARLEWQLQFHLNLLEEAVARNAHREING